MELMAASPLSSNDLGGSPGAPFQRRDVREWHGVDPLTGGLLRARVEADRWSAGPNNRYGKVVDSRDMMAPDGRSQTQRKQLEVLQTRTAEGSLQVVRSRTVSSKRWTSNGGAVETPAAVLPAITVSPDDYEDLKLPVAVHPLDVSSQRSKACVGRSGSISSRRPPSRLKPVQDSNESPVPIVEEPQLNGSVCRSNSTEDLSSLERYDDEYEMLGEWRRVSKIRRSLQFPKKPQPSRPSDLPDNLGKVSKIRQELENNRLLNTVFRGTAVDMAAVDSILKSINGGASECSMSRAEPEHDITDVLKRADGKPKRNAFITVNSLQEVRGRLRPLADEEAPASVQSEADDGIVEGNSSSRSEELLSGTSPKLRVQSYVFGMDSPGNTGSLESRKARDNEDWYERRKSYGFEGVQAHDAEPILRADASIDSGICRSTELPTQWQDAAGPLRGTVVTLGKNYEANLNRINENHTITTIPVVSECSSVYGKRLFYRQLSEGTTMSVEAQGNRRRFITNEEPISSRPCEAKSITMQRVDDISPDADEDCTLGQGKRNKKVGFCKTEVHFAAESGRVNIVETDGKPPPTQNFRRRRRYTTASSTPYSETAKSGLPVIHFGDTEQKTLLDHKGFSDKTSVSQHNTSTFSEHKHFADDSNISQEPIEDSEDHKPYNLGDTDKVWGVRLKPVVHQETTMWKAAVTAVQPISTLSDSNRTVTEAKDVAVEGSWSVADRIRAVEDRKRRGFSTKVNFGSGDPVIETQPHSWAPSSTSDMTNIDPTTSNSTTMIRIDLPNMSPLDSNFVSKVPHLNDSLKSTSLIMRTLHSNYIVATESTSTTPSMLTKPAHKLSQQLSHLRQLYEADSDDSSKADEEVKCYLGHDPSNIKTSYPLEETSSMLSGSWSRVRAVRSVQQQINKLSASISTDKECTDSSSANWCTDSSRPPPAPSSEASVVRPRVTSISLRYNSGTSEFITVPSVKVCALPVPTPIPLEALQSPALLRSDVKSSDPPEPKITLSARKNSLNKSVKQEKSPQNTFNRSLRTTNAPPKENSLKRETSPVKEKPVVTASQTTRMYARGARQLKEHELIYFGVKTNKAESSNKQWQLSNERPDLLRHSPSPTRKSAGRMNASVTKQLNTKHVIGTGRPKQPSPSPPTKKEIVKAPSAPIYENIHVASMNELTEESVMLEELTRAADEIIQAVNGYTDEDSHDEGRNRRRRASGDRLESISETAGAKKQMQSRAVQISNGEGDSPKISSKSSPRKGSSQSSKGSTSSARIPSRRSASPPKQSVDERHRSNKDSSPGVDTAVTAGVTVSKPVRSRRLQRASSREALLSVNGRHSSDDEKNIKQSEVPRRPRRTKQAKDKEKDKSVDRSATVANPVVEIRHKTATSTIRSVAEKAAARSSRKHREKTNEGSSRHGRSQNHSARSTSSSRNRAVNEKKSIWK